MKHTFDKPWTKTQQRQKAFYIILHSYDLIEKKQLSFISVYSGFNKDQRIPNTFN
jgi:hypothetical protein